MGAKQSKRSVDISGKEAESAGEVAAAGAGGEGRMEPLADADALKPQANGDAHIHETPEKEKQLDSGTPEIEKDATTEKENKDQEESEKEKEAPVTNGESEPKVENGDSTPSPDDGKKNKKEKVKKKWSLRSISFSRKDKPKQEKKTKDDEAKVNGEPEKVPEEVAETTPEVADETKSETENKDEKTPETPVTEPLTNGSSTPESPKVETPIIEEAKNENKTDVRPEPQVEVEPEKLPVNGLSLEESKKDEPEVPEIDSNKAEENKVEITEEKVPASEIPVTKEVCVDQTPLIESTPPPLPANPPPSSVASFAATTMAPELADASLANNADITKPAPADESPVNNDNTNDLVPTETLSTEAVKTYVEIEVNEPPAQLDDSTEAKIETNAIEQLSANEGALDSLPSQEDHEVSIKTVEENVSDIPVCDEPARDNEPELENKISLPEHVDVEGTLEDQEALPPPAEELMNGSSDVEMPHVEQDSEICELKETEVDVSVISQNEINERCSDAISDSESLKIKAKEMIADVIETNEVVMNGNGNGEAAVTNGASSPGAGPGEPAPADLPPHDAQESLPIADKIADLIPEIPTVPELKTEMETTTDVAVAN
ncbi:A-kinase anchor protein 200 [Zerene cesonia]|uniref:A-kinase anchor protein 200 n=1 Tax=Zerene cesonia TaxID=33412 RepID=UPI0018E50D0A|nr:A-kinase anchor protein 200 [Zerene cesonia]